MLALAALAPWVVGTVDFLLQAIWSSQVSQPFDAPYWLLIKTAIYGPWSLYAWAATRLAIASQSAVPDRAVIVPQLGLAITLILVHPAIVGGAMVGYGVPGAEEATLSTVYRDALLRLLLRDGVTIALIQIATALYLRWTRAASGRSSSTAASDDSLVLRSRDGSVAIPLKDVCWIRAAGNYSEVHSDQAVHVTRESIGHLAKRLDPQRFVRVHRSALVNRDQVRSLQKTEHGWQISLSNRKTLPVSRRRIARVRQLIHT